MAQACQPRSANPASPIPALRSLPANSPPPALAWRALTACSLIIRAALRLGALRQVRKDGERQPGHVAAAAGGRVGV